MAQNKSRKKKNKNKNGNHDVLGVTLIVISAFLLLCIVIKPILGVFSEAIFGVMLGVFGIAAYPCLIAVLLLGIFVLAGKKVQAATKTKVCISLAIVFMLIILQLASTHAFLEKNFTSYIDAVYSAKYSVGGIIVGLVAFGLKSLITEIACYVVFSIAFIVTILFLTSAFSRIRALRESNKLKKAQAAEQQPQEQETIYTPAQPQLVVDATPAPGLFTGRIQRSEPVIDVETGRATDVPTSSARPISDYSDSPVMDEPKPEDDHSATMAAARIQIYSNKEEIMRQAAEEFRTTPVEQPAPAPAPMPSPAEIMEPAERVYNDAQNAERPRRVDYDGTPNNLNALYFPPEKNIHFNDVGIESFRDEHPRTPLAPESEITDGSDPARPAFGMPRVGKTVEHVEPIIDASQPITPIDNSFGAPASQPLSAEDRFLRTLGLTDRDVAPAPAPAPAPETFAPPPVIEPVAPVEPAAEPIRQVPPLESDRFRADDIFDASDGLNNFGLRGGAERAQEEILDGSMPLELQSDMSELEDDDGILNGSLLVSDEPAVDMSERFFDNGDVFTGEDLSGMYVPADEQSKTAEPVKPAKPKKNSNAPLENQMTIESVLQKQAEESVVTIETKRYRKYNYTAPPVDLLKIYDKVDSSQEELQTNAQTLEAVVSSFLKTQVKVINIVPGPQVTRYEIEVPSGTSVKGIESRCADIAYELAAVGGVRVEAPIPGKRAVGIEVPNRSRSIVGLREVVSSRLFTSHKSPILFSVGKDIGGDIVACDLEKIPHFLVAGQTGSGKSAGLNSLLVSLLYKASPDDLRFILIDPKRVEFSKYRGMPHLLFERVITEPSEALNALKWADNEMNRRYTVIQQYPQCSKLSEYNNMEEVKSGKLGKLPHIVIIIDELANLMQSSVSGEIESKISSIAALARAVGIHLIVATQRPSADVVTGTIKANLGSRIAYKVPDITNSRIIIDGVGAEALAGDGDMLFFPQDAGVPKRVQGSFVSGEEVVSVVSYLKEHYECDFDEDAEKAVFGGGSLGGGVGEGSSEMDPLSANIMAYAIKAKQISTSVIQRRFSIGYARAARIIDIMVEQGYVGPLVGTNKPRDVLMTSEQYREIFGHDVDDN